MAITAIIVTVFYLAGIACAVESVMRVRTAQGAIAWSVSLVTFPLLAVPAYLVFGRSKFRGMSEAFADKHDEMSHMFDEYNRQVQAFKIPVGQGPSWYRAMRELSEFQLMRGNQVDLLINGKATFDSILAGITAAEHYILFQFYMIHDDGIGRRVQSALLERARAGVRVYVLYDEVGSSDLPARYVAELRSGGVAVSSFKPTQGRRNRFQLNFRNHRKMVVVDGKTAWVGGHNVGDEYLGLDPGFSPWRDTHVRLTGPVALQLQRVILSDWYWATRELPQVSWSPSAAEDADIPVMILPTGPTGHLETASLFFVSALSAAIDRIWLSAPYFVPDDAVMKALQLAALRGVDVRIITTAKPDSLPVYLAGFHYMHQLRGLGIRFYAFKPGFLHEKVALIDDLIAIVGTHNFDNRSFRLNFEVAAVMVDEHFASRLENMLKQDFAGAEPIDVEALEQKPFWWRLAVQLARLASPVL